MKFLAVLFSLVLIAGCATTPPAEKRTELPKVSEVVVTVRHLEHGRPLGYRFTSHDPQETPVTEQKFEVLAPAELKGRVFSIKILHGYEAPLLNSEYFQLKVPRYLVENIKGTRHVGDQDESDDGWNFAALVVEVTDASRIERPIANARRE